MSKCKKCGLSIGWKRLSNGKCSPTNSNGSDHWDTCKAELFRLSGKTAQQIREEDARNHPPVKTYPDESITHLYNADIPVWELEGEFRDFTEIEKVELTDCYSIWRK